MNNRRQQSIDGFVIRRRPNQRAQGRRLGVDNLQVPDRFMQPRADAPSDLPQVGLSNDELDSTLAGLDQANQPTDASPRRVKRRLPRLKLPKLTRKRVMVILAVVLLSVGAFFGIKAWIAGSKIFGGNLFDLFGGGTALQADANGRSNIVLFGTSEDDPGHEGAHLTDSIMVVSLDQEKNNAYMISIPRDLWVEYGQSCISGNEGKINVLYQCYSSDGRDRKAGAKALRDKVGEVLGLEVHYSAQVNYTAVRDLVDAVGGITVEIDSDDPRGILDRNFDWKCNYQCYLVKWPNGPAHLNGQQALALARARNAAGGYGLGGGNFDREQYQQKIMVALRDKLDDAGTLTNPVAISSIIDALGNNVRTSFSAGEVKTLINLAGEIEGQNIKSINLIDEQHPVMTTGSYYGQSIVQPIAGIYDFSEVHSYINSQLNPSGLAVEDASIIVLNGSDVSGVAGSKARELIAAGFINVEAGDTPTRPGYAELQWYDLSGGNKPKTADRLRQQLGVEPSGSSLPSDVRATADFVIILGNGIN